MKNFSPLVNLKKTVFIPLSLLIFLFGIPLPIHAETLPTPTSSTLNQDSKNLNLLQDLFSVFFNFSNSISSPGGNNNLPSVTVNPTFSLSNTSQQQKEQVFGLEDLVYYPQCGPEYGNQPLPSGCTLCKAGCGPTTVAMILSSYVGRDFTPKKVVDLYRTKGFSLGCNGSRLSDAKVILEENGVLTTNLMFYPKVAANDIDLTSDLRNYIKRGGWTMFALGDFSYPDPSCTKCHFFWIVDIDESNNIFAYDPYYGIFQIPYNENSNPILRYKIMFGVKKK